MDLVQIINELRKEREAVGQVIEQLERLAQAQVRRGGNIVGLTVGTRKPFSETTKRRMAEAQRKRWAAYRKAKGQA